MNMYTQKYSKATKQNSIKINTTICKKNSNYRHDILYKKTLSDFRDFRDNSYKSISLVFSRKTFDTFKNCVFIIIKKCDFLNYGACNESHNTDYFRNKHK